MEEVYLTTKEASDLLRVHIKTMQRMVRNREIEAFKVGGRWRIPVEEVEALRKRTSNKKEVRM